MKMGKAIVLPVLLSASTIVSCAIEKRLDRDNPYDKEGAGSGG